MAVHRPDGYAEDDNSWELVDVEKRKVTEEVMLAQKEKMNRESKKTPLIGMPVNCWKATPHTLSFQFDQEVANARDRHHLHKVRCDARGVAALPFSHFCFQALAQSGWVVKDGKFTLTDFQVRG